MTKHRFFSVLSSLAKTQMALVPYPDRTLGATVTLQVPATLEDLVASSNPANVRHAAIKHSLYQGWNNKFRKAIVAKLAGHTFSRSYGINLPSSFS